MNWTNLIAVNTGALADKAGELTQKGQSAVETLKSANIWDVLANIIPSEWNDAWDALKSQMLLWLIIVVVLFLLMSICPDRLRRIIRGLDIAVMGGVLVWLGTRIPDILFIQDLEMPLILIGIAMVVLGVLIFVFSKLLGHRRKQKEGLEAEIAYEKELDKQAEELAEPADIKLELGSEDKDKAKDKDK